MFMGLFQLLAIDGTGIFEVYFLGLSDKGLPEVLLLLFLADGDEL